MWIARDKNGELWIFENKPVKEDDIYNNSDSDYMKISDKTVFPELKWEDEPLEVDFIPKGKADKTDTAVTDRTYGHWTTVRNSTAVAVMATLLEKQNNLSSKRIIEDIADLSVSCADALIKKLKNTDIEL